ncbi:MAG: ureidoglycolate lyase [Pseudomonadota bacterium]
MTVASPLTTADFRRFGDVIQPGAAAGRPINAGQCLRFHDLARIDCADGAVGISLFRAEPVTMPLTLTMMERHPLGSQAFLPLGGTPYLVIVAEDAGGRPGPPLAFWAAPGLGVNYLRGTWHGVLAPLVAAQDFAVLDYVGPDSNLEEHVLARPVRIDAAP